MAPDNMKRKITIILIYVLTMLGSANAASIDTFSFIRLNTRHGLPENKIRGIVELSDGKIGLVTAGFVSVFNGNNFKSYHTSTFPYIRLDDFDSYRHVFRDSRDRIWIKYGQELMAFDPYTQKGVNIDSLFSTINVPNKVTNFFANNLGNYFFVNDLHNLYLWNEDYGLKLIDNISDTPYQKLERIDEVDGNIYLSFSTGLLVGINTSTGKRVYQGEIPIDFSQIKLKKGIVTLIANDKLIVSFNRDDIEEAIIAEFLLSEKRWLSPVYLRYPVTSLELLGNSDILVGGKELTQLSSDLSIKQHISELSVLDGKIKGNRSVEVSCLMSDSFGNVWAGTLEDGLLYYNEDRKNKISVSDNKFSSKTSKRYISERAKAEVQKIAPRITNATYEDYRGHLYIATVAGLIVLDKANRQIIKIDKTKGIDPDNIQSIVGDNNGDIWFTTPNSICRMKFLQSDSVSIASFNVLDGVELNGGEFRNCELKLDSLGYIHAGFTGGSCIFNPEELNDNRFESHFKLGEVDDDNLTEAPSNLIWIAIAGVLIILIGLIFRLNHHRKDRINPSEELAHDDLSSRVDDNRDLLMRVDSDTVESLKETDPQYADKKFLEKLRSVVESHISDPELSVQSLSEKMAMERSVLYRKMQALTNMSPSEYIKSIRLKIATQLLKSDKNISISELSEKVGFSNPKYFAKVFKSHFGMSPKEYKSDPSIKR